MRWSVLGGALLLAPAVAVATLPGPVPVSPGSDLGVAVVESRCPTFSWGSVAAARAYELIVYKLGEDGEPTAPELRRGFPAGVTSWTPTLESCLERGGHYAWAIRAITAEDSMPWSPATLFEIAELPGQLSRREALVLAQRLLDAASGTVEPDGAVEPAAISTGASRSLDDTLPAEARPASPSAGETELAETPAAAKFTVTGEVRSVGLDGTARVWGLGPPGTIRYGTGSGLCEYSGVYFGLSQRMVPWYAAQYACPVGTWVCQEADRGNTACDTERPDDNQDGRSCDESWLDWAADNHKGWIHKPSGEYSASTRIEQGNSGVNTICSRLPVWCCSQ